MRRPEPKELYLPEPKELYLVEGAGHFELYDIDEYVKQAVAKIVPFFDRTLRAVASALIQMLRRF